MSRRYRRPTPYGYMGIPAEARSFPAKSLGGELERTGRGRLGSRVEALLRERNLGLAVGTFVQTLSAA